MVAVRGRLGGIVVVLISLWALVGSLTKVGSGCASKRPEIMQAPLEATEFKMTKFIGRSITATFELQIDMTVERNISYCNTPLRDTPATYEKCVAKWTAQPPRRLLGRAAMLIQRPWDVWIGRVQQHQRRAQVYYAWKENRNITFNGIPAALIHKSAASWISGEPSRYYGAPPELWGQSESILSIEVHTSQDIDPTNITESLSLRRYCQPGASLGKQHDLDDENTFGGEDGC